VEENTIKINKYMYFNTENGYYYLTSEASELVYRKKNLICSYSGSNEWIHHFTCEMLDFCSGLSIYNYALGTVQHEKRIKELWKENKDIVINFVKRTIEESWSKKMYQFIETIIEEAEVI